MRLLLRCGLLVAVVAALLGVAPGAAVAGPVKVAPGVTIFNLYKGRCLDADLGAIGVNGTKVQLWDCNGWPNQTWDIFSDGTIRSAMSGRCLDAGAGGLVSLRDCTGAANQRWETFLPSLTGAPDSKPLASANLLGGAGCLDADLGSVWANGTKVQTWACNGWTNQHWHASAQAFDTTSGNLDDAGFEQQKGAGIAAPWASEGPDYKGVDQANGQSHAGARNGFIRAGSRSWNALTQHVAVEPNRRYRLQAWVRGTANATGGLLGVRGGQGTRAIAQTSFGPGGYQLVTVEFDSRYWTDVTVFAGYTAPGADSWLQVDDVYLAPEEVVNWAGYATLQSVHVPDPVTAVHARWTEPVIACLHATDEVSMWAGIDGIPGDGDGVTPPRLPHAVSRPSTLVQTGTDASCSGGLHHRAWYEVVGADGTNGTKYIGGTVMGGDVMEAWVSSRPDPEPGSPTSRLFDMTIANVTRGWTSTVRDWRVADALGQSGEVVIERPSISPVAATWPDLSVPVAFTDATVNGRPIGDWGPLSVYGGGYEPTPINAGQSAFAVGKPPVRPRDAGFEGQPAVGGIAAPWTAEGPDFKGIDRGGLAHTGTGNAFIRTGSRNWNAIAQPIGVEANRQYRVTAWVRTSGNVTTGQVGARRTDTQAVLGQGGFGPAPGYQQVTGVFNSGPNTLVQLFIGYTAPGADSWIQVDDVLVVPV